MFKKDTYEFEPITELVLTVHFGFIESLKKGWNHIYKAGLDKLKQHLKNAGNRLIKQICLKQLTGILSLDSSGKKIRQPTEKNDFQEEIEDVNKDKKTTKFPDWDNVIYDIVQTNGHTFSVKYSKISDIIREEEWVNGEMNTLSNIGSHQIVNLSFGAKKKEKKNITQSLLDDLSTHNKKAKKKGIEYSESNKSKDLLIVGDHVIVMNHGMKWINYAKVIDINVNEDWAIVKWESTSKNYRVKLCDCKKYEENQVGHKKQKPAEFYIKKPIEKHMKAEQSELEVQMENRFYSEDILSKLCAEGAVKNLMNMLHAQETYWTLFGKWLQ